MTDFFSFPGFILFFLCCPSSGINVLYWLRILKSCLLLHGLCFYYRMGLILPINHWDVTIALSSLQRAEGGTPLGQDQDQTHNISLALSYFYLCSQFMWNAHCNGISKYCVLLVCSYIRCLLSKKKLFCYKFASFNLLRVKVAIVSIMCPNACF